MKTAHEVLNKLLQMGNDIPLKEIINFCKKEGILVSLPEPICLVGFLFPECYTVACLGPAFINDFGTIDLKNCMVTYTGPYSLTEESLKADKIKNGLNSVCGSPVMSKSHPDHYKNLNPEPIDVIKNWDLNFNLGNVVKYVSRAGKKEGESALDDLGKAIYYLQKEIDSYEKPSI